MSKQEQFAYEMICAFQRGEMSREEVAVLLETTPRNVSRISKRVKTKGMMGIKHGNSGKKPANKTEKHVAQRVKSILQENYFDFNITHARDMLKTHHDIDIKYSTLRTIAHDINLVKLKKQTRRKGRNYRVRMPNKGLLLQMDGSHHAWNGKDKWVLIAAIDDATSEIPWAEFFTSEDTLNCMTVVQRIVERFGIPEAIYVDKAGWFGGISKRPEFSNFVVACQELGIKVIFANSPQAKGRIERTWHTFQDRLVPELRLHSIKTIPEANRYVREIFLAEYWMKHNTVAARLSESKYRPLDKNIDLREVFCLKQYRKIKPNQTVSLDGDIFAIKNNARFGSLKGLELEVRTYQDMKEAYFFAGQQVELIKIDLPLRYCPDLNGKKGAGKNEPALKRTGT